MTHRAGGPIGAAVRYVAPVFACGFVLGTVRNLWLADRVGATAAVALELPVMLAASWLVAGAVLRRRPLARRRRFTMGLASLTMLLGAEAVLAAVLGRSGDWLAAMATWPGALGLAGQVGFAVIPALRRVAGQSGVDSGTTDCAIEPSSAS
ncbi:MAG: hypothetical protein KGM17_10520 [Sphingomonadales bacterium]|nr:hypothetical protein [Sphingomonadales bacterium]